MKSLSDFLPQRRGNVILRLMHAADAPTFHRYRSDEMLARFQGWSVISETQALDFVSEMSRATTLVRGGWVQLAIAAPNTDVLLGDIGIYLHEMCEHAEIGFTLSREAQGHGYATDAVNAAIDLIFAMCNAPRVRAITDASNAPSINLLERTSFRRTAEQVAFFKGEHCTEFVYERARARSAIKLSGPSHDFN